MATELGQAYVQIMPSAKGISGSIQKQFDPEAETAGKSAGGKLGAGLKVAAVAAIAAAGIGKVVGAALTAGGDLQQSLGGVETLFKENADKVKQYANEAYKTAGLSANAYMENVTSFSASLLQSLGGDTEKAAEKANTAMIDMSDNSNKMGTSMESIQTAYQGFAKQNYTMLDNLKLGYGGTKTEMERLLADATKLSGVKYDISNLSDVYDAIHVVQTELGITGTTAKEAAETFSGSLASMKGAFANFLGNLALGKNLAPSLTALAETVSTFLFGNFLPMVGNILKALPGALVTFIQASAPYFIEAGGQFIAQLQTGVSQGIPNLIESAGNIVNGFIGFLLENLPQILSTGKEMLLNLVNGIIDTLPSVVDSAIKVVSDFIDVIIANLPGVVVAGVKLLAELVRGIISNLPELIAAAVILIAKFIGMILSKLPDLLVLGGKILISIVSGMGQVASSLYGMGAELMDGLMEKINGWKDKFFNAGKNIVTSIAAGIKSAIGKVTSAISEVTQKIRDYLPFSPAKEGPLKDLNKLDFGIIADGIYNAKKPVAKAMEDLARATTYDYAIKSATSISAGRISDGQEGYADRPNNTMNVSINVRSPYDVVRELSILDKKLAWGL